MFERTVPKGGARPEVPWRCLLAALVLAAVVGVGSSPVGGVHRPLPPGTAGPAYRPATLGVSGYVCDAQPDAAGPGPSGCGGDLPVANASVFIEGWSSFPSSSPVDWPPVGSALPHASTALTGLDGAYSLSFSGASGTYVLWTPNTTRWGGGFQSVSLSSTSTGVDVLVYPYTAQGNATFVLPGWNTLSAYASNANCLGCGFDNNGEGAQVPLTAWTQDGVFYVNATARLVFYSLANRTVRDLAPWKLLYDDVMYYPGIENTEWITADGSWVYEFGCTSACSSGSTVVFYAVNVTTGRPFEWNFTGLDAGDLSQNGQINLIGEDGNDSIAALLVANGDAGVVYGYGLWNHTQWKLASLPYFEANNIEWIPELNSYIDVEAQGSSGDQVSQWALSGAGAGGALREVASLGYWTGSTAVNGENFGSYNVTSHEFSLTSSSSGSLWDTVVFATQYAPSDGIYVMDGVVRSYVSGSGPTPSMFVYTSEHRATAAASGYVAGGQMVTATFYNQSSFEDPFNGMYLDTNVTLGKLTWNAASSGSGGFWSGRAVSVFPEGLFYNSSYGIADAAIDCRVASPCPIDGGGAYAPGTIYWTSPAAGPEFPFPTSAAIAEPFAPGPPTDLSATGRAGSVTLTWQPPDSGENPILNYTLRWGLTPEEGVVEELLPTNDSFTVAGLAPGETVYFSLRAANLHSMGPSASVSEPVAPEYAASLSETGLPVGATWWANSTDGAWIPARAVVGPNGSGSTILVTDLPNGTYGYSASSNAVGYSAPAPLSFAVEGANATAPPARFLAIDYAATFAEAGLPQGAVWWVNSTAGAWSPASEEVEGTRGEAMTIGDLTVGEYGYTVGTQGGRYAPTPGAGRFAVAGRNVTVPRIAFRRVSFTLTVPEEGLPVGALWWANETGLSLAASAVVAANGSGRELMIAGLANGTYPFSLATNAVQFAPPPAFNGTIDGANATAPTAPFVRVTYSVLFPESGLPAGATWWVNSTTGAWPSRSAVANASASSISVEGLENGTYGFTVEAAGGLFGVWPTTETFSLTTGSLVLSTLAFVRIAFPVEFVERGLPNGTTWWVTLNGTPRLSSNDLITFDLRPGSYRFSVPAIDGLAPTPGSGELYLGAQGVVQPVAFSAPGTPTTSAPTWFWLAVGGSAAATAAVAFLAARPRRDRPPTDR